MTKPIVKERVIHNQRGCAPYGFPEDSSKLRLSLFQATIGKHGTAIFFDKWMNKRSGAWETGLTDRLVNGDEERTNEFWQYTLKLLTEYKIWAKGALK